MRIISWYYRRWGRQQQQSTRPEPNQNKPKPKRKALSSLRRSFVNPTLYIHTHIHAEFPPPYDVLWEGGGSFGAKTCSCWKLERKRESLMDLIEPCLSACLPSLPPSLSSHRPRKEREKARLWKPAIGILFSPSVLLVWLLVFEKETGQRKGRGERKERTEQHRTVAGSMMQLQTSILRALSRKRRLFRPGQARPGRAGQSRQQTSWRQQPSEEQPASAGVASAGRAQTTGITYIQKKGQRNTNKS